MATFGKRVQPKHRATPGDRRGTTTPAPRPGSHAAVDSAETVAEAAPAPAPDLAPETFTPAHVAPEAAPAPPPAAPDTFAPAHIAPEAAPAPAPELETPMSLELPAAPVSVSDPRPPSTDPVTLRVLIVDDNEDVRGLLRMAFARAEIDVVGAASAPQEALAIAKHVQPGIILLDVNLPEVAGLDLLPQLREHCPQAKVVMFSAQVGSQVTETALERGAVGFVEKGVSMKNVITHLHDVARAPDDQVVEPFPLRVYA